MAGIDERTDSFITLVLGVSGQVRPCDLHGLSENEALVALESYRSSHPEQSLVLNAGILLRGRSSTAVSGGSDAPHYGPAVDTAAGPANAVVFEDAAVEAPPVAHPDLPSWYFEGGAAPSGDAPAAPDAAVVSGAVASEAPQGLPPVGQLADPIVPTMPTSLEPAVSWLWWIAVLFFGLPGAFVAWIANRSKSPRGARPFLIVSGVMFGLLAVFVIAAFVMGGFAAMQLSGL